MTMSGFTAELSVMSDRGYNMSASMLQRTGTNTDASAIVRPAVINYTCAGNTCCFWDDDLLITCGLRRTP